MRKHCFLSSVLLCLLTVIATLSLIRAVYAFDYFEHKIDYWKNQNEAPKSADPPKEVKQEGVKTEKITSERPPEKNSAGAFDWNTQLDPKNPEFFKEGDHTPPLPVMEMMRNPSDTNIQNWFKWIEKKNEMAARLQQRLSEYALGHQSKLKVEESALIQSDIATVSKVKGTEKLDHRRFRFRLYFESSCPHCNEMIHTLKQVQDQGYFVEVRQIDDNKKIRDALPFPVEQATRAELVEKKIESWPVLLIGDLKKKVVYRLNGAQSSDEIFTALRSYSN